MIRMVILPLSVVLLAASGYLHAHPPKQDADRCSPGLGDFITTVCTSSGASLSSFSRCSYTCTKNNDKGQATWTNHFLPNGLPCGECQECCDGKCQSVKFELKNPLRLKTSCSK
uniref:Putative ixostatin n=1 Tax=Ixodes ricinus TaxID=34613 RepID=A0A0K8R4L9_IXORI